MNLTIEVDGQVQLKQALDSIGSKISDWRPVFEVVEQFFYSLEVKQFQSQGSRANAWKPLSPAYAKWKAKNHSGKPILELTGALRRSLTGKGAGGIRILTPTEMALGSSLPYALAHQRGRGRMPARPPIDLTARDEKMLISIFLGAMAEIGAAQGFDVPYKDIYESEGVPF